METSRHCPIDRERIGKKDLVGAPRVVMELLGELRVRCVECKDEMKREDYGRHGAECKARKEENLSESDEDGQVRKSGSQVEVDDEDTIECSDCRELVGPRNIEVSSLRSSVLESELTELSFSYTDSLDIMSSCSSTVSILFSPTPIDLTRITPPQRLPSRSNCLSSRPLRMPSYRPSINPHIRSSRH